MHPKLHFSNDYSKYSNIKQTVGKQKASLFMNNCEVKAHSDNGRDRYSAEGNGYEDPLRRE